MSNVFSQLKAKFVKNSAVQKHKLLATQDKNLKWNIVVLGCILVTGVSYLVEVNGLATKGYKIRELEKSISQLKKENQKIQLSVIEARSLSTLSKKIPQFALVNSDHLDYLGSQNVAMAR